MSITAIRYFGGIFEVPSAEAGLPKEKEPLWLAISEPDSEGNVEFLPVVPADPRIVEDTIPIAENDLEGPSLPFGAMITIGVRCSFHQSRAGNSASHVAPAFAERILRALALREAKRFYRYSHLPRLSEPFIPGRSRIPYAGRVYDEKEIATLVDSSLDFWLTAGHYAEEFETRFARSLGVNHCLLTNSGSSANLLAFMALTSPTLGDQRIKKGDEVITVAAGFPTTVTPIIQFGAVPVFLDITLPSYNIDCDLLDAALSPKTKAVMLAHTLGNPFDVDRVLEFCTRHNLWLIEDCCDALGSTYESALGGQQPAVGLAGSFGHLSTFSFYPPHHITMGEGGAICTNDPELKRLVESFRDWGRDCHCPPGKDNTCGRRFSQQIGELPFGYDHKYVYSHFGYNLKGTDMQAAIGCAQLDKLPSFMEARRRNWRLLREGLNELSDRFILPEATPKSDPSWFGFLLTVRETAGFTRDQMVGHLESFGIQTRMLFAGNLLRHPCFNEMRKNEGGYLAVSLDGGPSTSTALPVTDQVMKNSFWLGVYPGIKEEHLGCMLECVRRLAKDKN
jgi:CDP-4-dehydro-6-deoxyglucose reductase, E1